MEDYTFTTREPGKEYSLGAHMPGGVPVQWQPSGRIEVHPAGQGTESRPRAWCLEAHAGPAGGHLLVEWAGASRLIIQDIGVRKAHSGLCQTFPWRA